MANRKSIPEAQDDVIKTEEQQRFASIDQQKANSAAPYKQSPFPMIQGTSGHASALKQTSKGAASVAGEYMAEQAAGEVGSKIGNKLIKGSGRFLGGLGILTTLKDFYDSGQEHSGGRVGYEKNPNYDPNAPGDKHGDADSNAQFIRSDGGKHTSVWDAKEHQTTGDSSWNFGEKTELESEGDQASNINNEASNVDAENVENVEPPKEEKKGWDFSKNTVDKEGTKGWNFNKTSNDGGGSSETKTEE